MNKKGRLICEFEVNFKESFISRSNLDLDIFSQRPGLKTGVKNAMFWSQSGEPAAHSRQKFPGVFPKANSASFSYKISFYSQVSNSETVGKVACRNKRHRCPATSCARPRIEKGQCCASCPDGKKLDSRAHYAGALTILFLGCQRFRLFIGSRFPAKNLTANQIREGFVAKSHEMSVIKLPEGSLARRRQTLWGRAKGLYRPIFLTPTEAIVVALPSLNVSIFHNLPGIASGRSWSLFKPYLLHQFFAI